jgi:putative ABC transport system permease protein
MNVIWKKVWFDLWHTKTRTLLAVLSIAAGVFAVGVMFGMADLMNTMLDASHRAVIAPHLNMRLSVPVDRDVALGIQNVEGVEGVQPYNQVVVEYKIHPGDVWKQGVIHALDDFDHQKYELVELRAGRWPKKDDIGIERMAAQYLHLGLGDTVTFKVGKTERTLPISGLIRHPFVPPPQFQDLMFFFMDGEGLERLGVPAGKFNNLFARVTPYSLDHAKEVATAIKDHLGKENIGVVSTVYQDPDKHWARSVLDGITLVIQVMAAISLLMGAVLIYNTLAALITQQTDQIGILKAIGGRRSAILKVYLSGVLAYGLLALCIALPLGALVCFNTSRAFLNLYNIDYNVFQVSQKTLLLQVIAAIAVPLLAGLVPVLQGASITVRQAIASYGLGGDFGSNWLDRAVERIGQHLLPSHYATALGNLFRRKGRLILTQFVLISAGTMFLMVMSLSSSISLTLNRLFERRHYDVTLYFRENQRVDHIVEMARSVDGVEQAELWFIQSASLLAKGQLVKEAGIGSSIMGVPAGSDFFKPLIVAGRWLEADDERVLILTRETAEKNHINVGDTVILDMGNLGKGEWRVVGFYEPVFAGTYSSENIYAPQAALYEATKKHNQGRTLYVRTREHDARTVNAVTAELKALYEGRGLKLGTSQTEHEVRQQNEFQFNIVTSMLLSLSIIVAVVGGIALMGALSIGVVERTKEIGVLRAVGARSLTLMSMFVTEGLLQGLLSWLIAVPVSFVFSRPLASALGQAMFSATLDYQYNLPAVGAWLAIIVVIATLASVLPARSATCVSVRQSLAYA